ncbi:hypothetical protein BDK51DRAFT_43187 [Blyttiomyces helicus]|uniref:Uncharacterized protein n=1 Tax=Blyttiomyces helicus TaxID=388810 RepID=A0A4P9W7J6_9FUNG|nr:hypothetical protein BDK51DRAFT_43187 [Blyttiomyces helicus]|eukprot:RKO87008.1 hypothetical protein BDK51DRAFT_43187 [Blyttiomyces helicus]
MSETNVARAAAAAGGLGVALETGYGCARQDQRQWSWIGQESLKKVYEKGSIRIHIFHNKPLVCDGDDAVGEAHVGRFCLLFSGSELPVIMLQKSKLASPSPVFTPFAFVSHPFAASARSCYMCYCGLLSHRNGEPTKDRVWRATHLNRSRTRAQLAEPMAEASRLAEKSLQAFPRPIPHKEALPRSPAPTLVYVTWSREKPVGLHSLPLFLPAAPPAADIHDDLLPGLPWPHSHQPPGRQHLRMGSPHLLDDVMARGRLFPRDVRELRVALSLREGAVARAEPTWSFREFREPVRYGESQ